MTSFHDQTIDAVFKQFETSPTGLSKVEAKKRLQDYGQNTLVETGQSSLVMIFLSQFVNPMIYILLVAGGVAIYLEEMAGAIFIFLVLLINAIIGTIQEYSAENAVAKLKKMVLPFSRVTRDGHVKEIDARQLVPGDIVTLESGCRVPADMRLIETIDAQIDESLLTGESQAVIKQADIVCDAQAAVSDQSNMVFAGTMVECGRLMGVVTATGANTKIGNIADVISKKSKHSSPLIIRMETFTRQVTFFVLIMILIIGGILYVQGYEWQYIFMLAIGIAVAAIPEGLPVTLTIALSIGMRQMAKRNVIVRKLSAVEALGSCTMIASDKTGTLTQNELTVQRILLPTKEDFTVSSGSSLIEGEIKTL